MADDTRRSPATRRPPDRTEREPSGPIEFVNARLVPENGKDIKESASVRFALFRSGNKAAGKQAVAVHWAKKEAAMYAPVKTGADLDLIIMTNDFGQGSYALNGLGDGNPDVIGITLQHPQAGMVTVNFPWVGKTSADEKKDEKKAPADIEVINPPRDPDPASGLFVVSLLVKKAGNLSVTSTPTPVTVQRMDDTGALAAFPKFGPVIPGLLELFVGFGGLMVTLKFKLDDGHEAAVRLRK